MGIHSFLGSGRLDTSQLAATRVFVFLISMLFSYYMYTILILNLFPLKYIAFWFLAAILSIIPGYIMWFSRADHLISSIITALPISAIAFEGYKIYLSTAVYYERYANVENVLVNNGNYFNMLGTEISYALMIIIILILVPKRKRQCLYIVPISIVVFFALVTKRLSLHVTKLFFILEIRYKMESNNNEI